LDVEEHLSAVTNAGDVETAKSAPGIVTVALKKAGVRPERALLVGDAVWDMQAAGQADVPASGSAVVRSPKENYWLPVLSPSSTTPTLSLPPSKRLGDEKSSAPRLWGERNVR
jgi:beta-phosphoglucomutase-like phosphatase (HAD superfamily)